MQEQVVTIYKPTVHLKTGLGFQNAIRRSRSVISVVLKSMQLHAMLLSLYGPENTNHELANNGSCVSTISIVTRLMAVIPNSFGSIHSNDMSYKYDM